jgi:hypothetical protein
MKYSRGSFLLRVILQAACCAVVAYPQVPVGAVGGVILDPSEAAIQGARIVVTNRDTQAQRSVSSDSRGLYAIPDLPPGVYDLKVSSPGFQTLLQSATVRTGGALRLDLHLPLGVVEQIVEATDRTPSLDFDNHGTGSVISRFQIENLPLNGREFLQLSMLEPGVTSVPTAGFFSRQVNVSVMSAPPEQTRVTMDAGPIYGPVAGGTPQNFSQEVVREFQISSSNFDLSTGLTGSGAANVVTQSGGNDLHGSAFYFFRDHNIAAYPALRREPANPDPFFARRQAGFRLGGPLKKDRLFFFTNFEHLNQDGVVTVQPTVSDLSGLGGLYPSSLTGNQVSARFDARLNASNVLFLRYSHDGNDGFVPPAGPGSLPSNWSRNRNWADQSLVSLTTTLRTNLVNDARFSYWYWNTRNLLPSRSECPGECIGFGMPEISILGTNTVIGNNRLAPQGGDFRRYHLVDNLTWLKGGHQLRFGFEWQFDRGAGFLTLVEPASMVLYSPQIVRAYNSDPRIPPQARIPLPTTFQTLSDILQLPLGGVSIGFGDPRQPPSFRYADARTDHILRFYVQDKWRVHSRLTVNYGIAYHVETNFANHDLGKPTYLAPLLGSAGLAPTARDRNNFAPSLGLAWAATRDRKTVIRAGAGVYYDLPLAMDRLQERSTIGPRGTGRVVVNGSLVPNPIPGLPTVPIGRPLNFQDGPTQFTGNMLLSILPSVRASLAQQFGNPSNTDLSIRNIEVFKQGSGLLAHDFAAPYSMHFGIGVQREVLPDLIVTADFVLRRFIRVNTGSVDLNRWNSAAGPVIPACSGQQALIPAAQCSTGPIGVQLSAERAEYKGLLIRVERRWSRNFQIGVAYALSSSVGLDEVRNNSDWFESYGPTAGDRRHTLTVSGIVDLPWGLRLSQLTSFVSGPPFRAQVFGIDFNGDGTINDVLPGTKWNQLNRGLDESGLRSVVADYNRSLAGGRTPTGQVIPAVTLPTDFRFGDTLFSTDVRLSKMFRVRERYELNVFGEVFNVLNIANLTTFGTNLIEPAAFGQPGSRATQVFGSGGPRSFRFGARISF